MFDIYFNNKLVTSYKVKKFKTAIKKAVKEYPELVKHGVTIQYRLDNNSSSMKGN